MLTETLVRKTRRPAPRRPAPRRALTAKGRAYRNYHATGKVERIDIVKTGLPARLLTQLAEDMQVTRECLYRWLGLARATANRKVKADEVLSQDESERVLGLARLIGLADKIVSESGEPAGFDAARWTAAWLAQPNQALGAKTPGDFMDTADGRALIAGLVAQMQSGAYA